VRFVPRDLYGDAGGEKKSEREKDNQGATGRTGGRDWTGLRADVCEASQCADAAEAHINVELGPLLPSGPGPDQFGREQEGQEAYYKAEDLGD